MTTETEQLIRSIEQQLENLMHFDGDLAYQYECDLYYAFRKTAMSLASRM